MKNTKNAAMAGGSAGTAGIPPVLGKTPAIMVGILSMIGALMLMPILNASTAQAVTDNTYLEEQAQVSQE